MEKATTVLQELHKESEASRSSVDTSGCDGSATATVDSDSALSDSDSDVDSFMESDTEFSD